MHGKIIRQNKQVPSASGGWGKDDTGRLRLPDLIKATLSGYAQIFFSTHWYVGLFFIAATFTIPIQGTVGLLALLLSNLWAHLFNFRDTWIRQGYFAYNGLLTGLALGMTYSATASFFIMLLIITMLGVLVAATLRSVFENYLFIPVLSTPFVLTTWMVLAAGRKFHGLIYTLKPFEITYLSGVLPSFVDLFFRSLGAAFFLLNTPAGILVALGVLIFSRHAFILAFTGFVSGYIVYMLLGGNMADLTAGYVGFNFALTAIAVGGIWMVPGPDAIFLGVIGSAVCAVIAVAATLWLGPFGLPPLAFPFVLSTGIIIYGLKQRGPSSRFKNIGIPEQTPEKNLKRHKNSVARFVTGEVPMFDLPVSGQWTITQGINGEHTHKDLWAHAWDFEIINAEGNANKNNGEVPEDFYAFNKPVYAPADGKIATVVGHIEDNPIGQVNPQNNWGNVIIIWHYGNYYSALCHLKKGTVKVNEGEVVRRGQIIAMVGNSGRSPVPHLHFQAQIAAEIGAPTVQCELMHYVTVCNQEPVYHTHGSPEQGDRILPLKTESSVFDTVSFSMGRSWNFKAVTGTKRWEETWETDIDFEGHRYMVCRKQNARIRFFVNKKVFLFLDYEGPRNTGLYWFFIGLPRLPMTFENVRWNDELPGELMLPGPLRFLFDLVEPVFSAAKLSSYSKLEEAGRRFSVQTDLEFRGLLAYGSYLKITAVSCFEPYKGLSSLKVVGHGEQLFELEQV
jgi:urea transporter/murein DD-endopeptidase MepM/ murein hydrolase activator NlpD